MRSTTFKAAELNGSAPVETVGAAKNAGISEFVKDELSKSERPELAAAKVVVSGGRGMQSGDNFKLLEAVAEELVNEVFVEVWRKAQSFESRSAVSTWLLGIAHHKALGALRRRREEAWNEDEAQEIMDEQDDPEVVTLKSDKGAALRRCLGQLSAEHREIVDLVYYHDKSVGEASAIVGIPEGTVKTRLFTARKRLSELMLAAGIDRGWP